MKFAFVNDELQEAQPGLTGICPCCGSQVVAKCGDIKVKHWSHYKTRNCDPWWENETEWHRNWKGNFPKEWQEFVHRAEGGEKHIADVKTEQGYVIEFQHSHIRPEERKSREDFYKKMIWIVDGTRRLRDKDKFFDGLMFAPRIDGREDLRQSPGSGPLINDWGDRDVLVFLDFGDEALWCLLPKTAEGKKYGFRVARTVLIEALRTCPGSNFDFDGLLRKFTGTIAAHEWRLQRMAQRDPLSGLQLGRPGYTGRRRF